MAKQFTTPASSVVMGGMRTDDTPGYAKIIYQNRSLLTVPPILAATFQGMSGQVDTAKRIQQQSLTSVGLGQSP